MTHYRTVWLAVVASLLLSSQAHAYLDPGTGSAIVQGVLAAFAALAVTAKLYWHRLLKLLGLRKTEKKQSDSTRDQQPSTQTDTGTAAEDKR